MVEVQSAGGRTAEKVRQQAQASEDGRLLRAQEDTPNFLELRTADGDASGSGSGSVSDEEGGSAVRQPQIVMDLACGLFDLQVWPLPRGHDRAAVRY